MEKPKDRLKRARLEAGFDSASEAARKIRGINPSTLSSNENGNRPISRKMAAVYASAFGVDAGWLLYGEGAGTRSNAGYSREVLISVAREMSDAGILPPNDDHDTVVKNFLALCDEHARRLEGDASPLDLLKNNEKS